ncbi:MAG TPA: HAD family hydrolase [Candidatus Limnocylindria bacterium]
MGIRAAFFDVGDTLVEGWDPDYRGKARAAVVAQYGERDWLDAFLDEKHEPSDDDEPWRQQTVAIIERWLRDRNVPSGDLDCDRIRALCSVPLDTVSRLTEGAGEALRWCKAQDLRVILVSNTLWRGDAEIREDWRRFGLGEHIDGVASSHDVGWRKPHRAMFERALSLADVRPEEAFMVGDRLRADIWGARQVGIRGVLRRTALGKPQSEIEIEPDAVVDTLTDLPRAVSPWL